MSDNSKRAYERYKFKHATCFKTCMLHCSKGGVCEAKREQIDHCLSIDKLKKDNRDYRSIETTIEWVEVLGEEQGIECRIDWRIRSRIVNLLETTSKDCYSIAKLILKELRCGEELQER